ncbi:RIP metalloprotease RseP [Candidatus Parcubacteria bacterium]|nr:RIP metalloprotease RseP [Candidatus Parcubacteria bacterium]
MLIEILVAFFSLLFLIILHEFGHFLMAKIFKVKVKEFGIFLPPTLIKKKIGETTVSLNLLPLGAFVKLEGEDNESQQEGSFSKLEIWKKALVVLGGVLSFWIISIFLFFFAFKLGTFVQIGDEIENASTHILILEVASNSPAQKAGLLPEDEILEIQNQKVTKISQFQAIVQENLEKEVEIKIKRGDEIFSITAIPRKNPPLGEGPLGVALARFLFKKYSFFEAALEAPRFAFNLTIQIISEYLKLIVKGPPPNFSVSGPVGIVFLLAQKTKLGLSPFLGFLGLLSIYLAIFNLLPIPALDGGKLLFLGIEAIFKKPISKEIEAKITFSFLILLLIFAILVTGLDIRKIATFKKFLEK